MRSLCYKGLDIYKSGSIGCNNGGLGVACNLPRIREPVLVRRMSRCSSKTSTASTKEELAFGRLMGFLCIIFMICWIPQLVSTRVSAPASSSTVFSIFFFFLISLFTVDHTAVPIRTITELVERRQRCKM